MCPGNKMKPVSAYILAHHIALAIQSVAWADEIIVLDTGSEDETKKLAAQHGANENITDTI